MCNAVFNNSIRNNYEVLSDKQRFKLLQSQLCSANFESYSSYSASAASLGIDVPVADIVLGLSGSASEKSGSFKQSYAAFCTSSYDRYQFRDLFQSKASEISSVLLNSWNKCIETQKDAFLGRQGVFMSLSPNSDLKTFIASIEVRNSITTGARLQAVHPDGLVQCRRGGKLVAAGYMFNSKVFDLTCAKPADRDINFSVETDQGKTPIAALPAVVPKETQVLNRLEADLRLLRDKALIVGEIRAFAVSETNSTVLDGLLRKGWVPADGRALAKTAFPELASSLGETWGVAPDAAQFLVPDLRGLFLRGYAGLSKRDPDVDARQALFQGGAAGNRVGSFQADAMQGHKHLDAGHDHPGAPGVTYRHNGQGLYDQGGGPRAAGVGGGQANIGLPVDAGFGQPRLAVESRPMNVAVYYFVYAGRPAS